MWVGVASSARRSEDILGGAAVDIDTEASEELRCGGGGRLFLELAPGGVPPGCAEARAIRSAKEPGGNCWPAGSGASTARGVTSVDDTVPAGEATGTAGERVASRGGGAGRELLRLGLTGGCEGVVDIPSSSEMEELRLVNHLLADPPSKMFRSVGAC